MKGDFMSKNIERSYNSWFIMIIVLLAATAAPLAMFKVSTVLTDIQNELGITSTEGGFIFSVFSLVPIFLAIPVGMIVNKFGNRKLGIVALICLIVGSAAGIISSSYGGLIISRIIEGVAMTLLATVGPNIVTRAFAPEKRGKAMGLFLCYIALGQTVVFNIAPTITGAFGGWKSLWWFTAIYSAVVLILWIVFIKDDKESVKTEKEVKKEVKKDEISSGSVMTVIKNADVWFITISFILFMIALQGVINFLSTYFTEVVGLDSAYATRIVGAQGIVGCIALVVSGTISDKLNTRKWMSVILMIVCGIIYAATPYTGASAALIIVLLIGFFANMVPSVIFSAITYIDKNPETIGLSIGILTTGQFIGTFLSTIIFGGIVDSAGWTMAFIVSAVVSIVGGIFVVFIRSLKK